LLAKAACGRAWTIPIGMKWKKERFARHMAQKIDQEAESGDFA